MVEINYIIAESNIIIKQDEINKINNIIEHHKKMVINHYNYPYERLTEIEYYINRVKILNREIRAYRCAMNLINK